MASISKRPEGRWRARYRDANGKEHAKHFDRKVDAQRWIDEVTAAIVTGAYIDPKTARTTVETWCGTWLDGYRTRRPSSVRQAEVHLKQVTAAFGTMALSAVRPSHVKAWTASPSTCPRRTAPRTPTSTRCTPAWGRCSATPSTTASLPAARSAEERHQGQAGSALRRHDGTGLGSA